MIVIAIIGILAAIAIPQFSQYRIRGYNTAARADVKNAYTAAQAFFSDSPAATVTTALITGYGFKSSSNVTTTVANNSSMAGLSITASHVNGNITYTVNSAGTISP